MPSRPEYVAGERFSAGELSLEQQYRWLRARQHSRFAHGWGVVCGLRVVPANDARKRWAVRICPGYAISPCGDEIDVRRSLVVDIADWLWALRAESGLTPATAVVAVRYAPNDASPISTQGALRGCTTQGAGSLEIVGGLRVDLLPDVEIQIAPVDLCLGGAPVCGAPAPFAPYVPLARVLLPSSNLEVPGIENLAGKVELASRNNLTA